MSPPRIPDVGAAKDAVDQARRNLIEAERILAKAKALELKNRELLQGVLPMRKPHLRLNLSGGQPPPACETPL
jgi:hypothetical protein